MSIISNFLYSSPSFIQPFLPDYPSWRQISEAPRQSNTERPDCRRGGLIREWRYCVLQQYLSVTKLVFTCLTKDFTCSCFYNQIIGSYRIIYILKFHCTMGYQVKSWTSTNKHKFTLQSVIYQYMKFRIQYSIQLFITF